MRQLIQQGSALMGLQIDEPRSPLEREPSLCGVDTLQIRLFLALAASTARREAVRSSANNFLVRWASAREAAKLAAAAASSLSN